MTQVQALHNHQQMKERKKIIQTSYKTGTYKCCSKKTYGSTTIVNNEKFEQSLNFFISKDLFHVHSTDKTRASCYLNILLYILDGGSGTKRWKGGMLMSGPPTSW
jgi:hypothetical protein